MRIGIYVGSFNPVHKGHIAISNYIVDNNYVDKLLIVPTGNYWNKNNNIDLSLRIKMIEKYENDKIKVEREFNDSKYTYELFRKLKKRYIDDQLYLIIGADNIISFDKWMNYKELLNYGLIIYNRDNIDVSLYLEKIDKTENYFVLNNAPKYDISSTNIRKTIKDFYNLSDMLDKHVLDTILEYNLYND
ncbi:MAG: nicotinate (nicotinamide) nucleotide adenylyltransferase [Bacilli bacterium]